MRQVRQHSLIKLLSFIAVLIYLNMSFVLAELSFLDSSDQYQSLVEVLVISGLEEKEVCGEWEESVNELKRSDVQISAVGLSALNVSLLKHSQERLSLSLDVGHQRIVSPPPES